jgi:hypothetical protein
LRQLAVSANRSARDYSASRQGKERRLTVSPFIEDSESPDSRPPALLSTPCPEVFPPTDPWPRVSVLEEIPEAASVHCNSVSEGERGESAKRERSGGDDETTV